MSDSMAPYRVRAASIARSSPAALVADHGSGLHLETMGDKPCKTW
ncbi:hypothetical protein ABGB16_13405 [Micromonospora sp. B11E3]